VAVTAVCPDILGEAAGVMARGMAHELLQFYVTDGGVWRVLDLTADAGGGATCPRPVGVPTCWPGLANWTVADHVPKPPPVSAASADSPVSKWTVIQAPATGAVVPLGESGYRFRRKRQLQ
jgi:hypothetical protein